MSATCAIIASFVVRHMELPSAPSKKHPLVDGGGVARTGGLCALLAYRNMAQAINRRQSSDIEIREQPFDVCLLSVRSTHMKRSIQNHMPASNDHAYRMLEPSRTAYIAPSPLFVLPYTRGNRMRH